MLRGLGFDRRLGMALLIWHILDIITADFLDLGMHIVAFSSWYLNEQPEQSHLSNILPSACVRFAHELITSRVCKVLARVFEGCAEFFGKAKNDSERAVHPEI